MLNIGKILGGKCGEANSPLQRTALLHIKPTPSAAVASWLSGSFWPPRLPNEKIVTAADGVPSAFWSPRLPES